MSRRAQTDSAETKRGLIASATEEFAEYGYEGASLRQICSKAGVTTGALYFFFTSKEDLFKSVVSPLMSELPAILASWIEHDIAVICDGEGEPTNVEALPDGLAELIKEYPLVPKIVLSMVSERFARKGSKVSDGFSARLFATMSADAFIQILATNEDLGLVAKHMAEVSDFVRGGLQATLR